MFSSTSFTLTENHIKLLSAGYINSNDEYGYSQGGVPTFDVKRPYGNSDIAHDIYYILNGSLDDLSEDELEELTFETLPFEYLRAHEELHVALEVVLSSRSFVPGVYHCSAFEKDWHYVSKA